MRGLQEQGSENLTREELLAEGELIVRAQGFTPGYYKQPEKTAELYGELGEKLARRAARSGELIVHWF